MSVFPCIIVHGGIEELSLHPRPLERIVSCRKSACIGYDKLMNGGSAIEAVEASLRWLEDDELFNCGYGSVLNRIGRVEMDASIMNGKTLECGSVVAVSQADHPISLARHVMEKRPNTIYLEESIERLSSASERFPIRRVSEVNSISPGALRDAAFEGGRSWRGAAGCVAWDGRAVAAGSTTGGSKRKLAGQLSHSALVGSGVYADGQFGCSLASDALASGLARRLVECGPGALAAAGPAGVALAADGSWASFGASPMPFACLDRRGVLASGADAQHSPAARA